MKNYLLTILIYITAIPILQAQQGKQKELNKQILKLSKLNYISLALDMATVTSDDDFIHFSKDKKTLYLPATNVKGEVKQGVFLIYKYDGNEFVFQQTGKIVNH